MKQVIWDLLILAQSLVFIGSVLSLLTGCAGPNERPVWKAYRLEVLR